MGEGVTSVSHDCKELASVPSAYHALGHRWGDASGHTLTLSPGASVADEELPLLCVGRAVRGTGAVLRGTQAGTSYRSGGEGHRHFSKSRRASRSSGL